MLKTNAWKTWNEREKERVFNFAEEYRHFISVNKTERKFLEASVKMAKRCGFKEISELNKLSYGDRIFKINKGKQAIFGIIGKEPLDSGARFIVAHIDAPRLDLKPNPLYEDDGIVFFKTCYYGGIKKYQWLTIPLALYGIVVLKTGNKRIVEIGDNPGDPVFTITDLLPHLSKDQMKRTIEEGFPGENLNILAATIPSGEEKEAVKSNLLSIFKARYGFSEDDMISSEFEMVPAGEARDLGMDKSLILGYGQDDRVCSYSSLRALIDRKKIAKECILCSCGSGRSRQLWKYICPINIFSVLC